MGGVPADQVSHAVPFNSLLIRLLIQLVQLLVLATNSALTHGWMSHQLPQLPHKAELTHPLHLCAFLAPVSCFFFFKSKRTKASLCPSTGCCRSADTPNGRLGCLPELRSLSTVTCQVHSRAGPGSLLFPQQISNEWHHLKIMTLFLYLKIH